MKEYYTFRTEDTSRENCYAPLVWRDGGVTADDIDCMLKYPANANYDSAWLKSKIDEVSNEWEEPFMCEYIAMYDDGKIVHLPTDVIGDQLTAIANWNDLYDIAENTSCGDIRLRAKDEARFQVACVANKYNILIEEEECPEDAVERFCIEYDVFFDQRGNIVEMLGKKF